MNDRAVPPRLGGTLPAFAPAIGLREVLEAAPDLVFSCDAWGRFAWVSATFELLTGYRTNDLVGASFASLLDPSERTSVARAFLHMRRKARPFLERDMAVVRGDGSHAAMHVRVRLVEHPDGETYFVGVAREREASQDTPLPPVASVAMTEAQTAAVIAPSALEISSETSQSLAALEQRVDELTRQLDEARAHVQHKNDVVTTLSHEIRTPMNGIIGMSQMLAATNLDHEQAPLVELIQQSGQSLLQLVNDSLDHARLESGRMALECIDFDLRRTVEQVGALLAPTADAKALHFDCRVDAIVPSLVQGDPGRLRQVLLNLGSNAIKFTERGDVRMLVERASESDDEVRLTFRVRDTGIGIDPEAQSHLFESFTQADVTIARRFGGSGLGLSISRQLVTLMGGTVEVESRAGEGSEFRFHLTLAKQRALPASSAATADVPLRGLRVLVADATPGERIAACEVLSVWGCETEQAGDAEEVLARLHAAAAAGRPFTVALLDAQLPGDEADGLAARILGAHPLAATLLLRVTAQGRAGDAQRARDAGFAAYLLKPLDIAQLHDAVTEVIAHAQAPAAGEPRALVTRHSLADARRGRIRILLVEDDAVNQLVTQSALNRVGYTLEVAATGRAALERTEHERWDLILMDMQMPDLDGLRATMAIRARERGAWRTPILGLTGNAGHPGYRERCLAAGMDDVFGKPIDLAALTSAVERWTSKPEARGAELLLDAPAPAPRLTVVSGHFEPPAVLSIDPGSLARDVELPVVPDGPALDVEQLNVSSMALPALRTSLLHAYLGDVYPRLERLQEALESGDPRRIEFEAHGLRGMCATIGATGCVMFFGEMELWAREERVADCRRLLEPALHEVQRTEDYIDRLERIVMREAA